MITKEVNMTKVKFNQGKQRAKIKSSGKKGYVLTDKMYMTYPAQYDFVFDDGSKTVVNEYNVVYINEKQEQIKNSKRKWGAK